MEIIYRYRLHWADILMFVGTTILLLGLSVWGFANPDILVGEDRFAPWVTLGVAILCLVLFYLAIPHWVAITKERLVVRTSHRTISVALSDIVSAEPFHKSMLLRASGVRFSGIHLSVGKFHNRTLGNFEMITTSRDNRVLITTRSGRKLIINCSLQVLSNHPYWKASQQANQM